VADDGQGIDPEFLPYVFERFRQADPTSSRLHMGLGLGLAIVRHLVELHGGHVRVESEGRGKGATFIVSLPLSPLRSANVEQPPPVRQPAHVAPLVCPPELEGIHVLIVEDDDDARELLATVLEPCKARISTASSVPDAMEVVATDLPDVIVSDIGLPGEDGYAFVRRLRALPADQGGRTPAIALTAYARVVDRTKALLAGFNMHVPKPVEPAELMAALASLSALFKD
jgi:CheY-like chemotaxis protein